ncbi:Double-strand break repair protein MRE11 [Nymphon striatum]|nr:Double-strand break repair protein MRE11 [Nymphon striatum]
MAGENDSTKEEDTFRILVATDCHLGFQEKDPIRGNDSMVTFEEILSIGKERKVDFILLAGDLFHYNKPSRKILHDTMQLLRKYCFGDKPVPFQFISQQEENFKHCSFPIVNYEDPNYNVGIPVFSIHGNHDDPAGNGSLCSLDLLSVTGLVNYFGKFTDLESINISPILLQKGITKLAMYGLGSMKDERLHSMMADGNVKLCPKVESSESFNLMAIHQNRFNFKHGTTNFIPEKFLDDRLDLVIWGHEHECRIEPERNSHQNFCVSQPGSSIATSLRPSETVPKHVGIFKIYKKHFSMEKIPLQTVRPIYVETIDLQKCHYDLTMEENVMEYCKEKLDEILKKAEENIGYEKQPKLPLVRLRVEHTQDDQIFISHRFGQSYVDKVANPKDLITFHPRRADVDSGTDSKNILSTFNREYIETTKVEDVVKRICKSLDENKQLMLLTEEGLTEALQVIYFEFSRNFGGDDCILLLVYEESMKNKREKNKNDLVGKVQRRVVDVSLKGSRQGHQQLHEDNSAIPRFVADEIEKEKNHLQTQQEFDEDNIQENNTSFKNDDMDVDDKSYQNEDTVSKKRQMGESSISAAKSDTDNSSALKRRKSNFKSQ